jgi:hypothetical protein
VFYSYINQERLFHSVFPCTHQQQPNGREGAREGNLLLNNYTIILSVLTLAQVQGYSTNPSPTDGHDCQWQQEREELAP